MSKKWQLSCPKCRGSMVRITQPDGSFLMVCRKCKGHRGPYKGKLSHLPEEVRDAMRR